MADVSAVAEIVTDPETRGFASNKLPLFAHSDEWSLWCHLFKANAKRKGYRDLLLGKVPIPSEQDPNAVVTAEERKVLDKNEEAFVDLLGSMDIKKHDGITAFGIIVATQTKDYPNGNSATAWSVLEGKYNPKTAPSLTRAHKEFYGAKLKKEMDPDTFLDKMEKLRKQMDEMGHKMEDRTFYIHLLNSLSREYRSLQSQLEDKLGDSPQTMTLTVKELRQKICLEYERNKEEDTQRNGSTEEHAMVARANGKWCHQCGKIGHIAKNCRDNKNTQSVGNRKPVWKAKNDQKPEGRKFEGECFYCHKKGHRKQDCFKYKREVQNGRSNEVAELALIATCQNWTQEREDLSPTITSDFEEKRSERDLMGETMKMLNNSIEIKRWESAPKPDYQREYRGGYFVKENGVMNEYECPHPRDFWDVGFWWKRNSSVFMEEVWDNMLDMHNNLCQHFLTEPAKSRFILEEERMMKSKDRRIVRVLAVHLWVAHEDWYESPDRDDNGITQGWVDAMSMIHDWDCNYFRNKRLQPTAGDSIVPMDPEEPLYEPVIELREWQKKRGEETTENFSNEVQSELRDPQEVVGKSLTVST